MIKHIAYPSFLFYSFSGIMAMELQELPATPPPPATALPKPSCLSRVLKKLHDPDLFHANNSCLQCLVHTPNLVCCPESCEKSDFCANNDTTSLEKNVLHACTLIGCLCCSSSCGIGACTAYDSPLIARACCQSCCAGGTTSCCCASGIRCAQCCLGQRRHIMYTLTHRDPEHFYQENAMHTVPVILTCEMCWGLSPLLLGGCSFPGLVCLGESACSGSCGLYNVFLSCKEMSHPTSPHSAVEHSDGDV